MTFRLITNKALMVGHATTNNPNPEQDYPFAQAAAVALDDGTYFVASECFRKQTNAPFLRTWLLDATGVVLDTIDAEYPPATVFYEYAQAPNLAPYDGTNPYWEPMTSQAMTEGGQAGDGEYDIELIGTRGVFTSAQTAAIPAIQACVFAHVGNGDSTNGISTGTYPNDNVWSGSCPALSAAHDGRAAAQAWGLPAPLAWFLQNDSPSFGDNTYRFRGFRIDRAVHLGALDLGTLAWNAVSHSPAMSGYERDPADNGTVISAELAINTDSGGSFGFNDPDDFLEVWIRRPTATPNGWGMYGLDSSTPSFRYGPQDMSGWTHVGSISSADVNDNTGYGYGSTTFSIDPSWVETGSIRTHPGDREFDVAFTMKKMRLGIPYTSPWNQSAGTVIVGCTVGVTMRPPRGRRMTGEIVQAHAGSNTVAVAHDENTIFVYGDGFAEQAETAWYFAVFSVKRHADALAVADSRYVRTNESDLYRTMLRYVPEHDCTIMAANTGTDVMLWRGNELLSSVRPATRFTLGIYLDPSDTSRFAIVDEFPQITYFTGLASGVLEAVSQRNLSDFSDWWQAATSPYADGYVAGSPQNYVAVQNVDYLDFHGHRTSTPDVRQVYDYETWPYPVGDAGSLVVAYGEPPDHVEGRTFSDTVFEAAFYTGIGQRQSIQTLFPLTASGWWDDLIVGTGNTSVNNGTHKGIFAGNFVEENSDSTYLLVVLLFDLNPADYLRMTQRNDGLGVAPAPRLGATHAAYAPRVGGKNIII